jgi:hypothetical protein
MPLSNEGRRHDWSPLRGYRRRQAWHAPSATELTALIASAVIGGLSHIFLTESYR